MDSAEAQNQMLFEKVAKNMVEGDFEIFREAAGLLTTWLSKRQAYYPTALIQIIRLLYIAQFRVHNEVKLDHGPELLFRAQRCSQNPFAAAYIQLVNATIPFQNIFLEAEKGLREGYQQLVASVSADRPEHEIPQDPQNRSTNAVELELPPTPNPPNSKDLAPSPADADSILELPRTNCVPSERIESDDASTCAGVNSPAPASLVPQKIEISRDSRSESKGNDFSVTCTKGVQISAVPTKPSTPPTSVSIDSEQIDGITTLDSPAIFDEADFLLESARTSHGEQRTNDHVDQHLPSPVGSSPGVGIFGSTDSLQGLHQQGLTKSAVLMDVTANSSTSNCNAVPGTREDGTMGSAVIQMEVDLMEVQKQWEESQDHSTGNGGASMETSGVPSEAFHTESNPMEVDGLRVVEPTVPSSPASRQPHNEVADLNALTESMNLSSPPPSRKMGIIARQQGLSGSFRIFIDFEITTPQFGLIKNWSKRLGSLVELESSICITLGCYLLADLKEQFETRHLSSFEQQIACTISKWPQYHGRLSLKVISADSKEENLPLSPPFQVTPNNLLDISGLLAEGRNRLQLHQTADLRDFLFVLHAHHPTPQQLEQVEGHLRKKKEWQQFLKDFSSPLVYDSLRSLLSS